MAAYLEIDEAEALNRLLAAADISIQTAEREEAQAQAVAFLRQLEALPINQPEGGVRVIVKGHHIGLKPVLWEIAGSSLSLIPKALDPTGISQVVGLAALGTSLIKLKDKLTGLSDFQILVCHAVTTVTAKKSAKKKIFAEPGASPSDVRSELRHRLGYDVPNIVDVLKNMSPKVLSEKFYDSSGPFYQLIP